MPTTRRSAKFDKSTWKKSPIKTSTFYGPSFNVSKHLSLSFTGKANLKILPKKEKITYGKKNRGNQPLLSQNADQKVPPNLEGMQE